MAVFRVSSLLSCLLVSGILWNVQRASGQNLGLTELAVEFYRLQLRTEFNDNACRPSTPPETFRTNLITCTVGRNHPILLDDDYGPQNMVDSSDPLQFSYALEGPSKTGELELWLETVLDRFSKPSKIIMHYFCFNSTEEPPSFQILNGRSTELTPMITAQTCDNVRRQSLSFRLSTLPTIPTKHIRILAQRGIGTFFLSEIEFFEGEEIFLTTTTIFPNFPSTLIAPIPSESITPQTSPESPPSITLSSATKTELVTSIVIPTSSSSIRNRSRVQRPTQTVSLAPTFPNGPSVVLPVAIVGAVGSLALCAGTPVVIFALVFYTRRRRKRKAAGKCVDGFITIEYKDSPHEPSTTMFSDPNRQPIATPIVAEIEKKEVVESSQSITNHANLSIPPSNRGSSYSAVNDVNLSELLDVMYTRPGRVDVSSPTKPQNDFPTQPIPQDQFNQPPYPSSGTMVTVSDDAVRNYGLEGGSSRVDEEMPIEEPTLDDWLDEAMDGLESEDKEHNPTAKIGRYKEWRGSRRKRSIPPPPPPPPHFSPPPSLPSRQPIQFNPRSSNFVKSTVRRSAKSMKSKTWSPGKTLSDSLEREVRIIPPQNESSLLQDELVIIDLESEPKVIHLRMRLTDETPSKSSKKKKAKKAKKEGKDGSTQKTKSKKSKAASKMKKEGESEEKGADPVQEVRMEAVNPLAEESPQERRDSEAATIESYKQWRGSKRMKRMPPPPPPPAPLLPMIGKEESQRYVEDYRDNYKPTATAVQDGEDHETEFKSALSDTKMTPNDFSSRDRMVVTFNGDMDLDEGSQIERGLLTREEEGMKVEAKWSPEVKHTNSSFNAAAAVTESTTETDQLLESHGSQTHLASYKHWRDSQRRKLVHLPSAPPSLPASNPKKPPPPPIHKKPTAPEKLPVLQKPQIPQKPALAKKPSVTVHEKPTVAKKPSVTVPEKPAVSKKPSLTIPDKPAVAKKPSVTENEKLPALQKPRPPVPEKPALAKKPLVSEKPVLPKKPPVPLPVNPSVSVKPHVHPKPAFVKSQLSDTPPRPPPPAFFET